MQSQTIRFIKLFGTHRSIISCKYFNQNNALHCMLLLQFQQTSQVNHYILSKEGSAVPRENFC